MSNSDLPPLTPETIRRAKEGLNYACDRSIRQSIETALTHLRELSTGNPELIISGNIRKHTLRRIIQSLFRVSVEYPENIPQNAAILAPNHLNHIDPFLLLSELPDTPYHYILGDARTLYNQWWKRQILKFAGGVIPLERRWGEESAILEAVKTGYRELHQLAEKIEKYVAVSGDITTMRMIDRAIQNIFAQNNGIILFPEGRLGKAEGQLMTPLKRGLAVYALRSGIPIVPVAIIGTKNLYLRKKLTIRFGEPILISQSKHPSRSEINFVMGQLEKALRVLLPNHYRESDELQLFNHFLNHLFY